MSPSLSLQVLQLYEDVDREVAAAGPICQASGRCCRFKEFGHVLFVSNLEAEVLLAGAPAYEQPVSPDFCPFQKDNLCTAREHRPLGCRIYYCDPGYEGTGNQITEKALTRLKALAEAHGVPWRYAPLYHFLNDPQALRGDRHEEKGVGPGAKNTARAPLPLITKN
jgi:Fe-S-cluster containining protein